MTTRDHRTWLHDYRLQSLISVRPLDRLYAGAHRVTGQRVMVRQILPGVPKSEQEATASVVREHATRMSTLTDPHLLPVLEFTAETAGPLYLVTDVPRGTTLGELVSYAGTLPTELVAALGIAIAKRLRYAHAHSVCHLALHRESVLIRPDGTVTITDLGLAAMWVARLGPKLRQVHSAWGAVFPEPGCVPPEVLANESLGPWTDIYGLGALMYTLATTQTPFDGKSVVAFNSIISAPTPPDPRRSYVGVDEELAEVIVGCLHRSPSDRAYESMDLLLNALQPLAGSWPEAVADYQAALSDHSWLERYEPRLRVVEAGDERHMDSPAPTPAVVPLFDEPEAPMNEAELLARMTADQRAIYLSGGRAQRRTRGSELRRGALLGAVLAVVLAAFFLPDLWESALRPKAPIQPAVAPPQNTSSAAMAAQPAKIMRSQEKEQYARRRRPIVLYLD